MKGYFPITIPTKRYIKAYLIARYGETPIMDKASNIGNKFYDLLHHPTNERKEAVVLPSETIKVYVHSRTFRIRGCNLNETNIRAFNKFVEMEIKERFFFAMDILVDMLPSFEANLPAVRKMLMIDDDEWSTDSMKKEYYRYRKQSQKPMFYKKTFSPFVPSEKAETRPY